MQVQINTDKNIDGNERLVSFYTSEIERELAHFDDKITRVEVHFKDENSDKISKNDKSNSLFGKRTEIIQIYKMIKPVCLRCVLLKKNL